MALTLNGSSNTITPVSAVQPAGSIIQVIQTVKTDTFSNANEAFADITGLSVAITPTSSSNKILINYGGCGSSAANRVGHIRLARVIGGTTNTSIFIGDQGATNLQVRASSTFVQNNSYYLTSWDGQFLDSPSTTSAITYKLQLSAGDQSYTVYVGRSFDNSNEWSRSKVPSFITVMEVAA
tara:strand:+ start:3580 stop:4122 length:543 start_codon:yes stop_codon:yes gene_type:complete